MYAAGFLAVTFGGVIWWQTYRGEAWKFAGQMLIYYAGMLGAVKGFTGGYEAGRKWMKRRLDR